MTWLQNTSYGVKMSQSDIYKANAYKKIDDWGSIHGSDSPKNMNNEMLGKEGNNTTCCYQLKCCTWSGSISKFNHLKSQGYSKIWLIQESFRCYAEINSIHN